MKTTEADVRLLLANLAATATNVHDNDRRILYEALEVYAKELRAKEGKN